MNASSVCSSHEINASNSCCQTTPYKSPGAPEDKMIEFAGRSVKAVKTGILSVTGLIHAVGRRIVVSASEVAVDSNAVAAFYRKLEKHVINLIEYVADKPGQCSKMGGALVKAVSLIDFVQMAGDADYFLNRRYKENRDANGVVTKPADNKAIIGARLSMAAADIGGSLLWMQELGFLKLSQAAEALGKVRVFSFVPKAVASIPVVRDVSFIERVAKSVGNLNVFGSLSKVSCVFVTLRALDLMWAFFAVDAAKRLSNAPTSYHKISASLDLTSYLSELALNALVFAGVSNVIVMGIMGSACITMALASFLYRSSHSEELKETAK